MGTGNIWPNSSIKIGEPVTFSYTANGRRKDTMSTRHCTMRRKAKISLTYRLAKRNAPSVSMKNMPPGCSAASTPCKCTNTIADQVAAKKISMSGDRIRPKDPDTHDIKQGRNVTISTSRYGDKRTEPRKKKNGSANNKKKIAMSEETFCPCRRTAAVRPAPLRSDLPA